MGIYAPFWRGLIHPFVGKQGDIDVLGTGARHPTDLVQTRDSLTTVDTGVGP